MGLRVQGGSVLGPPLVHPLFQASRFATPVSSFILWSHPETYFQKIAFFLRLFYENYIDLPYSP